MREPLGGLGSALAWLVFPLVPVVLGNTYQQYFNSWGPDECPDPYRWGWQAWLVLTGPLVGYGFLAGATLGVPDDPDRRGLRAWLARRSVWVAVGPWAGFLFCAGVSYANEFLSQAVMPANVDPESWTAAVLIWAVLIGGPALAAYGWVVVALAVLRRARRLGRCRQAIARGLAAALGFAGSLFGTFWALIELCRNYFFDPRTMPILLAALTLALASGCAGTITYGEVRRRELFQALLMAWLVGLALAWRWWSRPRSKKPPGPG